MIVGCYLLSLYCDATAVPAGRHVFAEFPHDFTSEFGSTCRRKARRAGWKLDLKTGMALCPKCAAAGAPLPEDP